MRPVLVPALFSLLLAACAAAPKAEAPQLSRPITEAQVAAFAEGGTGRIKGQAFLRQDGGAVVTCSGSEVLLMPDTPSTREIVHLLKEGKVASMRVNGERPSKLFPHAFQKKWCNREGAFRFDRLARGSWILMTGVHWRSGMVDQGGVVVGYLDVTGQGTEEITLSHAHLL